MSYVVNSIKSFFDDEFLDGLLSIMPVLIISFFGVFAMIKIGDFTLFSDVVYPKETWMLLVMAFNFGMIFREISRRKDFG